MAWAPPEAAEWSPPEAAVSDWSPPEADPSSPDPNAASSVRTEAPSIPPQDFNWGDFSARIAAGITENTMLVGQGLISAGETAFPVAMHNLGADKARDFFRSIQDRAKEDYLVNRERDSQFASKFAAGLSSLPPIVASAALGPAGPIVTNAALMGESFKQEAESLGGDEAQQSKAFLAGTGTGIVTEALLGLPALLRSAKAAGASDEIAKGMAREIIEQTLKNSGREASQEALEQMSQNFTASTLAGYDPDRKIMEGVPESAVMGALIGAPTGAITQASESSRVDNELTKAIAQPEQTAAEFQQPAEIQPDATSGEATPTTTQETTAPAAPTPAISEETSASRNEGETEKTSDYNRYQEIQSEISNRIKAGDEIDSSEVQALWQESEQIKNRNGGMPPKGSGANLGPGAANIEEFGPVKETSTKNVVVDDERAKRGELPLMKPARESLGSVWDKAMERAEKEPDYPGALVDRIRSGEKTTVSQEDEAILLHEKIRVDNEQKMAADRALDQNSTEEERAEARLAFAEHTARLNEIDEATQAAGTIWGRTGRFRQIMARDDFTLSNMVRKVRMANEGAELTPEQYAEVEKLHTRIAELEKKLADKESKKDETESTKAADEAVSAMAKASKGKKTTETPETARARITSAIKQRVGEGDSITDLRAYVQKLAEQFVRSGVDKRDPLVDAVHSVLQTIDGKISRRQTQDLISGYGDFKQLDKDAAKATLRDLKGQLQQLGKLEDITSRQPPKKTGVERRAPSDEERRLIREVNEAKKKYGVVTTDPATQLRSALDAIKARLKNQIRDMAAQFDLGKQENAKEPIEYDEEANRLREMRDRIKATLVEVEGTPQMTDEQRAKIAKRTLAESIAEYERRIREGETESRKRSPLTPKTPELEAMRARRDALRSEFQLLQDLDTSLQEVKREQQILGQIEQLQKRLDSGNIETETGRPTVDTETVATLKAQRTDLQKQIADLRKQAKPKKTAEEISLQSFKTRTKNQIAELQERIAAGDLAKRPKRELALDKEAQDLKFQAAKVKEEFAKQVFEMELKNRSLPRKVFDSAKETLNTARALITSLDLSAVFRQGNFAVLSHPIKAAKAIPDMLRAFASEKAAFRVDDEIMSRPNAALYKQAKLYLSEPNNHLPSRMEEAYMSRWAKKIPLVKGSERAFTTFLNRLRADVFDTMAESFADGKPTPEQAKDIAAFINAATGRGSLGAGNKYAAGLNTVLWSPKLLASRIQLLLGQPIWAAKSPQARKLIAKEYARFLTGAMVVYALASMAQDDDDPAIELDPRSSDFLKVRFGDTRLDPLGGLIQVTVLASRLLAGAKKTQAGNVVPIHGEKIPYGGQDAYDVAADFIRSKMNPVIGAGVNVATGKDYLGQPTSLTNEALGLVVPLSLRDIKETMQEQGVPKGTVLTALGLLGMGVQTYETKKQK